MWCGSSFSSLFCSVVLLITEGGMFKSPSRIVNLPISLTFPSVFALHVLKLGYYVYAHLRLLYLLDELNYVTVKKCPLFIPSNILCLEVYFI